MKRRVGSLFLALVLTVSLGATGRASAHQPVVLGATDSNAVNGPLLPDGTISWAVYGTVGARSPQGFRARFSRGDAMVIELLIPATGPERTHLGTSTLRVRLSSPTGKRIVLVPTIRQSFTETFTQTSYIRLARFDATATEAGVYGVTVDATSPTRWCVAIGTIERFDSRPVDEDRPTGLADVQRWYRTHP